MFSLIHWKGILVLFRWIQEYITRNICNKTFDNICVTFNTVGMYLYVTYSTFINNWNRNLTLCRYFLWSTDSYCVTADWLHTLHFNIEVTFNMVHKTFIARSHVKRFLCSRQIGMKDWLQIRKGEDCYANAIKPFYDKTEKIENVEVSITCVFYKCLVFLL